MTERDPNSHVITEIVSGSIAEELGLEVGDELRQINNQPIKDIFDFYFLMEDEYVELLVYKTSEEEEWILEIEKDTHEDVGIRFDDDLMDKYKTCRNKCVFCFIDQLPEGMRETLYFKDDDSRLSFLKGNYITLTNMKEEDIQRIIKYHMSPINVSVHTTNPELRKEMLTNRFAGDVLTILRRLASEGITLNGQIVLCKGINDGEELDRSIRELSELAPIMQSVSVVPFGLTKFREGLKKIEPITKEDACQVINLIESWQDKIYKDKGIHFIHASDELYLTAEKDFPEEDRYDGYLQIENGVGMVRNFIMEFKEALAKVEGPIPASNRTIATSTLPLSFIKECVKALVKEHPQLNIQVEGIVNEFFGQYITVSGLLTGADIINQLKDKELGDALLLPDNLLKDGTTLLLDNMTVEDIERALGVKVIIAGASGRDLLDALVYGTSSLHPKNNYEPDNI